MSKQKIIALTGSSGSGKTALAVELAKDINGEIISVDSRQIYKELDIGTAKPTQIEKQGIPHYMTDITDVNSVYTAADYSDAVIPVIEDIFSRGKIPVMAGGTGLYFRVLLQDFDLPRVAPDNELREELNKKSSVQLYEMLKEKDPETAVNIHFNNKVKIIRALEVCIKLNKPMSLAKKKKEPPYNTLWYGLGSPDRQFLYDRINKRTDLMMQKGLFQEAEALFKKYPDNNILLNTIGYQEFYPVIKGKCELESAVSLLKQNTRRYAKRQISWFNANKEIKNFDIKTQSLNEIKEAVIKDLTQS